MYFVDDARATLDGADLGQPARWPASPVIGEVPLPARGVLAIGQAVFAPPGLARDGVRFPRRSRQPAGPRRAWAVSCGPAVARARSAGVASSSRP